MTRHYDIVVVGGSADGLVAATVLARAGSQVLLIEAQSEVGGTLREIEFAPGYRAAPLAPDLGHLDAEVLRATGLSLPATVTVDSPMVALGEGEPLRLERSVAATAAGLRTHSARDAEAWPAFAARMESLAGFLGQLYRLPAPAIDPESLHDYLDLLRIGRSFRALGRNDMVELLRAVAMPVADLLDDSFESPRLKGALAALAVSDLCRGPASGGTSLALLHRQVGAAAGAFGERLRLAGGPGVLIAALAERARLAGVTIETGAQAQAWVVDGERVAGVRLASGEEVRCNKLLSALDPHRSLLELLDPAWLDPNLVAAVRNIRYRGATSYLLCALYELPEVPGLGVPPAGGLWIAPSMRDVERAYDAAKYGRCSDEPVIELRFPSLVQRDLAPEGRHVAVLRVQYTPWLLRNSSWNEQRDGLADRVLVRVERELPGFSGCVLAVHVLTPVDLAERYDLREGAVSRGETMLDQMLLTRPVPGCARHATPMPGLWLCGAGTHPGPGLTGLSGLLAARAMSG